MTPGTPAFELAVRNLAAVIPCQEKFLAEMLAALIEKDDARLESLPPSKVEETALHLADRWLLTFQMPPVTKLKRKLYGMARHYKMERIAFASFVLRRIRMLMEREFALDGLEIS